MHTTRYSHQSVAAFQGDHRLNSGAKDRSGKASEASHYQGQFHGPQQQDTVTLSRRASNPAAHTEAHSGEHVPHYEAAAKPDAGENAFLRLTPAPKERFVAAPEPAEKPRFLKLTPEPAPKPAEKSSFLKLTP